MKNRPSWPHARNIVMRKSKGYRSRTRSIFKKELRTSGKLGLSTLMITHDVGDKVCIKINSSVHKGMPHKRYQGRVGTIDEKRGKSYVVSVPLGGRISKVISRPEHIHAIGS